MVEVWRVCAVRTSAETKDSGPALGTLHPRRDRIDLVKNHKENK
jgi:hypothetical protein